MGEQNIFRIFKNYIKREFSHFINSNAFINGNLKGAKLRKNNFEFAVTIRVTIMKAS